MIRKESDHTLFIARCRSPKLFLLRDIGPLFCSFAILIWANDSTFDAMPFPIDLAHLIALLVQSPRHLSPYTRFDPAIKAACHRAPEAITFGQVPPGCSCSPDPENSIDNQAMVLCWSAHFWLLWWEQGSQSLPLLICKFSFSHRSSPALLTRTDKSSLHCPGC